jgi:hypothetical protein
MMRRPGVRAALASALVALAACSGTEVKSGTLKVSLAGPSPARGVVFRVVGTHTGIAVPAGQPFRVFTAEGSADTVIISVVANQGNTLSGAVVQFAVPDTRTLPTAVILQVASPTYAMLSPSAFTLSVAP